MSRSTSFFSELQRRHVYKVGAMYAVAGWLLVQVATQVFPFFEISNAAVKWTVIVIAAGFPVALVLAWLFDVTPEGIVRTESTSAEGETPKAAHARLGVDRKLNYMLGVLLIAGLGYEVASRLVVKRLTTPQGASALDKSVAVLPLTNESSDQEQQYFSDGLSENLIIALSQFPGLKVIGRSSSFQFRNSTDDVKTIGSKLGVAHLLEGSVQRAGDVVRISAALVNTADGSTVWSQRYDRPYRDLFALQDEITQAVAGAMKARLLEGGVPSHSDRPPSGNLDAYNAFLLGRFHRARSNEAGFRQSIQQFDLAVKLDPTYATAYAEAAGSRLLLAGEFLSAEEARHRRDEARTLIDHALQLAPDSARAHAVRGFLRESDFDWPGAEADYRRYVELDPEDAWGKADLALIQAALGHPDAAIEQLNQALVINPLQGIWYSALADNLSALGRLDEAETAARKAVELLPQAPGPWNTLVTILIQRGDAASALDTVQRAPGGGVWRDTGMAMALQIGPDHAAADTALKTLIDRNAETSAFQIAEVYALRRDPDHLFEWLDRAWALRDTGIQGLLISPFTLRYLEDPRYIALCKKVGLPTTTTAKAMP